MDKKKFDKIMADWATHEMETAPDLKPRPEVYQKLEEKKKKSRFTLFSWPIRLAATGIAAVLITLVIVIKPPREVEPLLGLREGVVTDEVKKDELEDRMTVLGEAGKEEMEQEEQVPDVPKPEAAKVQRKVVEEVIEEGLEQKEYEPEKPTVKTEIVEKLETPKEADKEDVVQPEEVAARPRMEIEPGKKEVKSQIKRNQIATVAAATPAQKIPERIEFQYQPKGSETLTKLDISSSQEGTISLSSDDNYRLIIQFPQDRYVYVYQVGAEKRLIRLFPNSEYNPAQNPLQAGKTLFIPFPPNWFYVEKDAGEVLVYVATSPAPLVNWEKHYAEYSQASSARQKRDISEKLLDLVKKDEQDPEDQVTIHVFKFNIR